MCKERAQKVTETPYILFLNLHKRQSQIFLSVIMGKDRTNVISWPHCLKTKLWKHRLGTNQSCKMGGGGCIITPVFYKHRKKFALFLLCYSWKLVKYKQTQNVWDWRHFNLERCSPSIKHIYTSNSLCKRQCKFKCNKHEILSMTSGKQRILKIIYKVRIKPNCFIDIMDSQTLWSIL